MQNQSFTVVKFAQDEAWQYYWEEDPKITGVHLSHSAAYTYSGKSVEMPVDFVSVIEAENYKNKLNEHNSSGCYDICPVISNEC